MSYGTLRDPTPADRAAAERLKQTLRAGDLGGAFSLIHELDQQALSVVMLHAGFSVPITLGARAFLRDCQAKLSDAARRRVDGFGLRQLQVHD